MGSSNGAGAKSPPKGAAKGTASKGNAPKGGTARGNAPKGGAPKGGAPKGGAPKGGAPKGGAAKGGGPSAAGPAKSRLAVKVNGVFLDDEAARAMWLAFSAHMDAHENDFEGFARSKGFASAKPEHQEGRAVLTLSR